MIVNAEELAWALDTHILFAQAVLNRIRARQRGEYCTPTLPTHALLACINGVCVRCGKPRGHVECLCPEPAA